MENFKDVKIIKKCVPKDEKIVEELDNCDDFKFDDGDFLKTVDKEILFVDDSIHSNSKEIIQTENIETDDNPQETQPIPRKTPPICFENIPKKLNEQMSLPIENVQDLCYYESFIISENTDNNKDYDETVDTEKVNEIGSACLMVEELCDRNLLIFTIQQIFVDGVRTVYESLSVVTKDLRLIHEKRIERKCSDGIFMEKTLFIIPTATGFRLIRSSTLNDETQNWSGDVTWTKCGDFISTGANVILTRKLVMDNFKGCIQLYTCDLEGNFALTQYWFHSIELKFMYDHSMVIKRVDQLMIYDNSQIENNSCFFLAQTGRLLKQIGEDQHYFIFMNPFVDPYQQKYTKYLQENWEDDVQLMSMYMERKAKRKEELKRKFESPHMKLLLNDYIHNLIKCKPKSIMNFTVEFMRKLERNTSVNVQLQIFKTVERRTQQK